MSKQINYIKIGNTWFGNDGSQVETYSCYFEKLKDTLSIEYKLHMKYKDFNFNEIMDLFGNE